MINDIFCVEYRPNHSGFLLIKKDDLRVKKTNHQPGKDKRNLTVREVGS